MVLVAGALMAPAMSSGEESAAIRNCEVRLVHRGQGVPGVRITFLVEGAVHEPLARGAPTTDSAGRARVPVEDRLTTFTPYLVRDRERLGWTLFVLPAIDARQRPSFCRDREVIELPDTLVRVNVTEDGRPLSGAAVGVDNLGVRLGNERPPERGVVMLKARTGLDGSVEIPGLAPGSWTISANTRQSEKHAEQQISVREGATVVVDLAVAFHDRPPLPYDQHDSGNGAARRSDFEHR